MLPCGKKQSAEISPVPSSTFIAFRFPYAEGFFKAAPPDSSPFPWPSPTYERLGSLLSGYPAKFTTLQNSLHVTDCYFAHPSRTNFPT